MPRDPLPYAVVALVATLAVGCHRAAAPTTAAVVGWGTLRPVALVDQDGASFGPERMRGRVFITAFLFTSCPMECPLLAQRMGYVQTQLATRPSQLQMLAVSINPAQDTPPVLRSYGEKFHRDPARWTLVTGDTAPWYRVVAEGYEHARPPPDPNAPRSNGTFAALHGERFVLVDGEARIRGYYGKDDAELARMLADADRLIAATPAR